MRIFHKDGDYPAFQRVLAEGMERHAVEMITFCLVPNHWRLVVRPGSDDCAGPLARVGGRRPSQEAFQIVPVKDPSMSVYFCRVYLPSLAGVFVFASALSVLASPCAAQAPDADRSRVPPWRLPPDVQVALDYRVERLMQGCEHLGPNRNSRNFAIRKRRS